MTEFLILRPHLLGPRRNHLSTGSNASGLPATRPDGRLGRRGIKGFRERGGKDGGSRRQRAREGSEASVDPLDY